MIETMISRYHRQDRELVLEFVRHNFPLETSARVTNARYKKMLSHLGFFAWRWSHPEFVLMRMNLPNPELKILSDPREWYLTMGDGDLEMSF